MGANLRQIAGKFLYKVCLLRALAERKSFQNSSLQVAAGEFDSFTFSLLCGPEPETI